MIDRQHGKLVYECDTCPETLDTEDSDWGVAKAVFDLAGWRAEKVGADWIHFCPECK